MTESRPGPGAVDARGLHQLAIHVLQRGDKIDHVEARVEPHRGHEQRGHDVIVQPGKLGIPRRKDGVEPRVDQPGAFLEKLGKHDPDEDQAHQRRGEEDEPEDRPPLQFRPVEQQRETERDRHLHENRANSIEGGVAHGLPE
jgi:hypothetical protein